MTRTGSALIDVVRCDRSLSFFAIFVFGFVLVLTLAIVGSLIGWKWRAWIPGAEGSGSLVKSVSAAVCSFMSFIT
jgi:hypothetical protein